MHVFDFMLLWGLLQLAVRNESCTLSSRSIIVVNLLNITAFLVFSIMLLFHRLPPQCFCEVILGRFEGFRDKNGSSRGAISEYCFAQTVAVFLPCKKTTVLSSSPGGGHGRLHLTCPLFIF